MEINKEILSKYNIHYLRGLARGMGVKCPTALRKKELIEKIIDIDSGKLKPRFTKVGKPPLRASENKDLDVDIYTLKIEYERGISNLKKIKSMCLKMVREIDKYL